MTKSLENIRVLDLSRILAGPLCTQMLGDLGAEIIKVERPQGGDDTRSWGPPFLKDESGNDTTESAYYLSCNRNKKSIALDITTREGQDLLHKLIAKSDIVIENFKVGGLAQYGLSYDQIKDKYPALIYCSITGFGQTGPMAHERGYDFLAQGLMGLMAATGAKDGGPTKVGVAISDILTGMNATIGILAALHAREKTGKGQHIDVALTDCTLAAMTNIAQYTLTSGKLAPRVGNAHSTIVPYQTFATTNGHIILAIGNDSQFRAFCGAINHLEWADDPRFALNRNRVQNRETLIPLIEPIIAKESLEHWLDRFQSADLPCAPINTMDKVFEMPQIKAREMEITMNHPLSPTPVHLVGSPIKLSATPVSYNLPPPVCGAHTREILEKTLDLSPQDIAQLHAHNIVKGSS